jgi:hypothetical protein
MLNQNPKLITVKKIWSESEHNAMTDLIQYKGLWYCIFRESTSHVHGDDGKIRLIASDDGENWESVVLLTENGVDLRDPKLSITPDGRLMMLVGGTIYEEGKYISRQSRVSFSDDGTDWSSFQLVIAPHEWLWRVTWHHGKAYGASYSYSNIEDKQDEWNIKLWESDDGIHYKLITEWSIVGHPNETTLQFLADGRMLAFVRRDGPIDKKAWMGVSKPPFIDWEWHSTHAYFGGPNFIVLPDQSMVAAGRVLLTSPYGIYAHTVLASLNLFDFKPQVVLPSWEDCSYPGLAHHDGELWMSYYSTHENDRTSIYLAKFRL